MSDRSFAALMLAIGIASCFGFALLISRPGRVELCAQYIVRLDLAPSVKAAREYCLATTAE